MRLAIILSLIACCSFASAQIRTRFVDLPLDHFNPLDRRSFDGRYFVNNEHYLAGGPIFIYVGGGFEVYDSFLARGAVFEIAQDTRGILFTLEHRYFGESRPTEDTSVQNLRWLSTQQAIADLATFINFIRANYFGAENSRVILWGRGYGGSLAVWARQKYPSLIDGVWASSAPVNAVLEHPQFMPNAFRTINQIGGPECGDVLTSAFRMIEDAIRTRDTAYVEERLKLCSPIDVENQDDITRLFYGIAADIGATFVANAAYPDIDEKCILMRSLNDPSNPPINAIDAFARWFIDEFNRNVECLDYNNANVVAKYQQVEWNTISTIAGRRQNFWIHCTQLGQFPVANEGENHPWGWRFDAAFFRQWCAQAFDANLFTQDFIEQSIASTNAFYGGLNPHVYNVFFTHGEMDPTRSLGPLEDINDRSPVVVMSLQSFGRDFGSPSETDYVVLQETKEQARQLILKWILDSSVEPTPEPETTTQGGPAPAHDREPAFNFL